MAHSYKPGEISPRELMIRILVKELGLDRNDPTLKDIQEKVWKDLIEQCNKMKLKDLYLLSKNPSALTAIITTILKSHTSTPIIQQKEYAKLTLHCLKLMEKHKQNEKLYQELHKILTKYGPALNSDNPNEVARALKMIMIMVTALEIAAKKNDVTLLEKFIKNPEKMELDDLKPQLTPSEIKEVQKEFDLTDVQMANKNLFGTLEDGSHQQAPAATTLLEVVLAVVKGAAMSHLVEKVENVVESTRSDLPRPTPPWEQK